MLRRNHHGRRPAGGPRAGRRDGAVIAPMPLRFSHVSSALIASAVGFAGTPALIVAAAQAVGATPAQTVSWITAISLTKALEGAYLTLRYRMPIVTAWSTPGAALIGASTGIAFDAAIGAFVLAGALGTAPANEAERDPALLAFVVGAAGMCFGGVGAAFRGLCAGLLAHGLEQALRRWRAQR